MVVTMFICHHLYLSATTVTVMEFPEKKEFAMITTVTLTTTLLSETDRV